MYYCPPLCHGHVCSLTKTQTLFENQTPDTCMSQAGLRLGDEPETFLGPFVLCEVTLSVLCPKSLKA